ncbi:PQQ-dependent sugar dehydrogenase [Hyphomicrobium sp.]|jgi:glucose/arabinose dehydrogenase/cytochrome c5|uniref:PQQ-dependent sugar dehydrogenase n=1 Tax=Hyphomicrobium sp. TaxID=82 RepID=UPI002C64C7C2|nr:PQQ-dependent sugar dehydrogenase [Hyphomicrobium sp.]HVZ04540.1 PQQ-dependent sugar dehydrogenase [Hyphomicrobium sp.]
MTFRLFDNSQRLFAGSLAIIALQLLGTLPAASAEKGCSEADAAGIALPKGFCATIFADKIGHARQLVVAPDGTVYVNTWSGVYYNNDTPHEGGFLVALKDTKGNGHADSNVRFGPTFAEGAHGGTGIALYKNWLYAEINDKVVRYDLKDGAPSSSSKPETILSGMPTTGDHPMHAIAIDTDGNMFVSMGSATNTCEVKNRMPHSPGNDPCTEAETRAGIWRYDANKLDQAFSAKERYAYGIRNPEGMDFDTAGRFYATQHGRDQLHEDWPELYTAKQGRELPSEEVVIVKKGAWYGWPKCYYDPTQKKLVLGPEYGGDGGEKIGDCDKAIPPIAAFPAHWAPNDLKIYKGSQFPKAYVGGAFIAFHGSWNRAPGPQAGYNVVFQPLADGKPSGDYVVFANGFAGAHKDPGRASHRPSGLAVGPDGALYISDDVAGRVWRVTYNGDATAAVKAADAPKQEAEASPNALPPEGIHPQAGKTAALPVPQGATAEQVALGQKIFHGEVADATCSGCHGANGIGTPVGPDLTSGKWLWSDGSLYALTETIKNGVPEPKQHPGAMPPMGGVKLSDKELAAVASYVWAIGHQKKS